MPSAPSFEALLQDQAELYGRVARLTDNLKKLGQPNITEGAIKARLACIDRYWQKFEAQHELLRHEFGSKLERHDYTTSDLPSLMEAAYFEQKGALLDWLPTEKKPESTPPTRSSLPRIELPTFAGRYENWAAFKDLFQSIIGRNGQLSDVEKLHYLKTSLRGEARTVIKDLQTTGDNYRRAWEHLNNRYENKRLLVRSCLTQLATLAKIKTESVEELKRIFHTMTTTVSSLESIGRAIFETEDLFLFTIVELFDNRTRREWEGEIDKASDPPTYAQLRDFLEHRIHIVEALQSPRTDAAPSKATERQQARSLTIRQNQANRGRCLECKGDHFVMFCSDYKAKTPAQRLKLIQQRNHCLNCLGNHQLSKCPSKKTCTTCSAKHHTTLHDAMETTSASTSTLLARKAQQSNTTALLATMRVEAFDRFGNPHAVRALVDQGSETSLITERLAQRLHLPRTKTAVSVCGVGGTETSKARGRVTLTIQQPETQAKLELTALVLPRPTLYSRTSTIVERNWSHLDGIKLADPNFMSSDPIDLLLGVDVHAAIIAPGLRRGRKNEPIAQRTSFGWILSGMMKTTGPNTRTTSNQCAIIDPLAALVRQFWEQEVEPRASLPATAEEQECEELFTTGHICRENGRYMVRLPVKSSLPNLHGSREASSRILAHTERRFKSNTEFETLYKDFLKTYETMGHMEQTDELPTTRVCYLPHHGVWRESSTTTKLRVVFNGSWQTKDGTSLNDHLYTGRNLLPALSDLLLRWRTHTLVIGADVEKMYRKIQVHPSDRDLQRILWRANPGDKVRDYRLTTVTYGLACAPFLAIRTLHQLAHDERDNYPRAAQVLLHDVYVDDILSGAETVADLQQLQREIQDLCMAGGFPLRKWITNSKEVEESIPVTERATEPSRAWAPDETGHATLGLKWNQDTDCFSFNVRFSPSKGLTKRTLLSQAAQLFDPLGWLTPVTIKAKITVQSTWLLTTQWDEPLPETIMTAWQEFYRDWALLRAIRIPRAINIKNSDLRHELHGFADASERAYAAVIYLRSETTEGNISFSLLAAKSRVAPLKQVSLPRLELCAAHLLATLTKHTIDVIEAPGITTCLWSDSTIVLGWIQSRPTRWKTYVANRVAEIQRLVPEARWQHVAGTQNPADCASRGLAPADLIHHSLWWTGPVTSSNYQGLEENRKEVINVANLPEERTRTLLANVTETTHESNLLERTSSYVRLLRVTAWCRRWLPTPEPRKPALTNNEISAAEQSWVRLIQSDHYPNEINAISQNKPIPGKSSIIALTPFTDENGLLRVGGRLKHSPLSWDEKHPMILPAHPRLSVLLIESMHRQCLHGGVQLTLSHLRQRFWIPGARAVVKHHIHHCVTCVRWRAEPAQQRMADLPEPRVRPARPFQYSGVDYAGPIMLRTTAGRGHQAKKAFLVIFVCMVTKAVHLDVASDYSARAFLAALQRMVARRGMCSEIYSDRGTTFIGTDSELRRLFAAHSKQTLFIRDHLATKGIKWCFNPPAAPHFGGLWEAAVKSTKHHLRRVIGDATLTYEEMATLLAQIEACLNSRPLCTLTDDPTDVSALTPGHLLIGTALTAIPEPSLLDTKLTYLTRWQLLSKMRDHFWKRWSREYIQSLIPRPKWHEPAREYRLGQLCLIRDEITPPSKWPLARITKLHPGSDKNIRVVTVKTKSTELVRPIAKLVLLPLNNDDATDL